MKINPSDENAWYKKACCYALKGHIDLAVDNLKKAIKINFEYYKYASTDSDFDQISFDERFKASIDKESK